MDRCGAGTYILSSDHASAGTGLGVDRISWSACCWSSGSTLCAAWAMDDARTASQSGSGTAGSDERVGILKSWVMAMPADTRDTEVRSQARKVRSSAR